MKTLGFGYMVRRLFFRRSVFSCYFSACFTNLPFSVLGFGLYRKLISDCKSYYVVFVAQWIARRTSNPEVAGSNPAEDGLLFKMWFIFSCAEFQHGFCFTAIHFQWRPK